MSQVDTRCDQPLWSRSAGEGPPVLLLHGLGASAHYWDRVSGRLPGMRVTAPDLLGFGRSPAPSQANYDVDCHLEALEPFVTEGITVVGHSTGSTLAAAVASRHPDKVRALVLVSLPAYPDAATARREVGRLSLLARWTAEERLAGRLLCEAMCRFRPLAVAAAPLLVRDLPRQVAADGARHTWESYSRTLRNVVIAHPVADELRRARCPVTMVHGREDRSAPLRHVERLAADLGVKPTVIRGDHHLPIRQPREVAEAISAAVG